MSLVSSSASPADFSELAVVIAYKPVGKTSNDVLMDFKKLTGVKKVGHGGTLDPFASGLLPCFIGKYTKLSSLFHDAKKRYVATLKLGMQTDTGDCTGQVIQKKRVPALLTMQCKLLERSLIGPQKLKIPLYSAKKVNGKPLYQLAREKKVTQSHYYQQVFIEDLQIIPKTSDEISLIATVSSGTYMRSLGELIAQKIGSVGHLTTLDRTHYYLFGKVPLETSISIEKDILSEQLLSHEAVFFKKRLTDLVPFFPLKRTLYRSFLLGTLRYIPLLPKGWILLSKQNHDPLGLIYAENGFIQQRVFFSSC
jgi:tRNA pseudouridine55 synthase